MWIQIKKEVIRFDEIMLVSFNDADKSVILYSKYGATILFGQEFRQGMVPRERVISVADYAAIKAWVKDKQNPEVVV